MTSCRCETELLTFILTQNRNISHYGKLRILILCLLPCFTWIAPLSQRFIFELAHGHMVTWSHGPLSQRFIFELAHGHMVTMVTWSHDPLSQRFIFELAHGHMVTMVTWSHGHMVH